MKKNQTNSKDINYLFNLRYETIKQFDSIQKNVSESKKPSDFSYCRNKKSQFVKENNTKSEIIEKFIGSLTYNYQNFCLKSGQYLLFLFGFSTIKKVGITLIMIFLPESTFT